MLKAISRSGLEELLGEGASPRLSFYLPTHGYGPGVEGDHTQLKNLLRRAAELLARAGVAADEGERLLQPLWELLDDREVWQQLSEGLAIFLAPGELHLIRAHVRFAPQVTLGRRFRVAPLIPALPRVEHFYVLALSINAVRLLEVTPLAVRRLDLTGMPASMEAALGYDQYYSELQVHSAGPVGLGRQRAIVHGHGDDDEERHDRDLATYFRQVADGLRSLPHRGSPVVLATVEEHYPLFRRVSGDLEVVTGVAGNPELAGDRELAETAGQLLDRLTGERISEAVDRFRELSDRRRVSADTAEIVDAAHQGRVDTLFVTPGVACWGAYEPDLCQVEAHAEQESGDDDLVDLAVTRTLTQGGAVVPLPAEVTLGEGPLAAILRYPVTVRSGIPATAGAAAASDR